MLYEAIRRATRVRDGDELQAQTLAAWLAVHGIATLWLSGNLPYERDRSLVAGALAEIAPALAEIAQVGAARPGGSTSQPVHQAGGAYGTTALHGRRLPADRFRGDVKSAGAAPTFS